MLKLTKEIQSQLAALGIEAYPHEGCGLLLGQVEGKTHVVSALFPVANSWQVEEEKRERFLISPQDMMKAEMAAAERDLDVIGVFHSHPDHPPIASPRDLAWAAWSGFSYLITEIRQRQARQSRSWQLLPDRSGFVEEPVLIDNGGNRQK